MKRIHTQQWSLVTSQEVRAGPGKEDCGKEKGPHLSPYTFILYISFTLGIYLPLTITGNKILFN